MLEAFDAYASYIAIIAVTLVVVAIVLGQLLFATKQSVAQLRLEQQQLSSELNTAFGVIKKLEQSAKSSRVAHDALQLQVQELNDALIDSSAQIESIKVHTEEIEQRDPQVKLYAKASALVADGASIDDIMSACDLDRAEVELLKNIHSGS